MSGMKTREEKNLEKARRQLAQAQAKLARAQPGQKQKRPKLEKDPRVNVGPFSWGFFLCVFLGMLVINGSQIMVYIAMSQSGLSWVAMAPSLAGFAVLMSLVVCCVIVGVRSVAFNRPARYLGDAAQKLAAGDFSVRVAPMRTDGKKDYMEVLIDDFNTMAAELGSLDSMKDDLIGNVSHEIKTPVSVIQNYASALLHDDLAEEKRGEYTLTIVNASKKLSYLVTNILMLNKLENQGIVASTKTYNLSEQLAECAIGFEEQWETRSLEFSAALEDSSRVKGDPNLLEIVWRNLLGNAIKFSENGGTVTLTQKNEGGQTIVSVTDTGCGMDEETQKHIFDKFYQGDTSHSQEGNGLGLALVKRVVGLSGGETDVRSRPGEGTTMTVKLPLQNDG